jgi:hypothetical protein
LKGKVSGGSVIVAIIVALLLGTGVVSAGTFDEVYVDGERVPLSGNCNLYYGVYVEGVYAPATPYDAVIDWRINAGTWHRASTTGGADGRVAFWFTVNVGAGDGDTLYIRATESNPPGTYYWECTDYGV